jgi:UV DNA damage endonuclease
MNLDETAKVQIHVGGFYGNKMEAMDRFIKTYNNLHLVDHSIKKRLVIENDDHLYGLLDCLYINQQTGIPIVFDSFHHECYSNGEFLRATVEAAMSTWDGTKDGLPMVDYSCQDLGNGTSYDNNNKNRKKGRHAQTIDMTSFEEFLNETVGLDFDMMLEIKDKEKSALKALCTLKRKNFIIRNN